MWIQPVSCLKGHGRLAVSMQPGTCPGEVCGHYSAEVPPGAHRTLWVLAVSSWKVELEGAPGPGCRALDVMPSALHPLPRGNAPEPQLGQEVYPFVLYSLGKFKNTS